MLGNTFELDLLEKEKCFSYKKKKLLEIILFKLKIKIKVYSKRYLDFLRKNKKKSFKLLMEKFKRKRRILSRAINNKKQYNKCKTNPLAKIKEKFKIIKIRFHLQNHHTLKVSI